LTLDSENKIKSHVALKGASLSGRPARAFVAMVLSRRSLAWIRLARRHILSGLGGSAAEPTETTFHELASRAWSYAKFGGVLICCQTYLLDITMCVGPSMMPTFNALGDIVLCDKLSPRLRNLRRGDVVVCKSPTNAGQTVCKRIVGLPGDALDGMHRDHAWRDQRTVPTAHVWLEGDNRRNSMDSRNYGPVPIALVQSRVVLKLWPLSEAGWVGAREGSPPALRYSESVRAPFDDSEFRRRPAPPERPRRPPAPAARLAEDAPGALGRPLGLGPVTVADREAQAA
jgi:signal peptidase I